MNPFNQYQDQTEPMNQEKYFNIQNRPAANELTLGVPTSGENTIEEFGLDNIQIQNKNLENYISRMENRGKKDLSSKKPEDEQRIRIFKKPLDSLGARKERIDMVKGLVLEND